MSNIYWHDKQKKQDKKIQYRLDQISKKVDALINSPESSDMNVEHIKDIEFIKAKLKEISKNYEVS